ncbi:MAG: glycosyltransferase [Bacilli bacterium]|nr:glycosyltransferase [Bacilli bacterium]
MKTISILIPTYNEEDNIKPLCKSIKEEFKKNLPNYAYEIIFIDNYSLDKTRDIIKEVCKTDKHIKAIFNIKNFGQFNSPYYGLMQTTGDATILLCADFQDPIDMIHKFVKEWENGYKIVIGIKNKSKENKIVYFFRTCYYKIIKKFSSVEQIEHFTGFGLYDKDFINILKTLDDSQPYLRGIVAELGFNRKEIPYTQPKRKNGKSKNNWYSLYDAGMVGITSYTKGIMRLATISGFILAFISFIIGLVYLIMKLIFWDRFLAGIAPVLIGLFFMGSILLFFIGFLGEYILNINIRLMKRPLVIEEKRINFK